MNKQYMLKNIEYRNTKEVCHIKVKWDLLLEEIIKINKIKKIEQLIEYFSTTVKNIREEMKEYNSDSLIIDYWNLIEAREVFIKQAEKNDLTFNILSYNI